MLRRPIPGSPGRFEPIEHFGYFDGLSQPIFTKPDLDKYDADQGGPAQPGDWDPGASLDLILANDPFTARRTPMAATSSTGSSSRIMTRSARG